MDTQVPKEPATAPAPAPAKLDYALLENGLDYILTGLRHLRARPTMRNLKYAITNLATGTELIFKERLRREHWALVFDNVDEARLQQYQHGDIYSANFPRVVSRLANICGIHMEAEEIDILDGLRRKRNRLEHFGLFISPDNARTEALAAARTVFRFIARELPEAGMTAPARRLMLQIHQVMAELDASAKP